MAGQDTPFLEPTTPEMDGVVLPRTVVDDRYPEMDRRAFIGSVAGGILAVQQSATAAHAAPSIDSSWARRSTAPGVLLATDFSTDAEVLPYRYANAPNATVFNERIKRVTPHADNGVPCLRIAVVAPTVTGDTQGQAWRRRFRPTSIWPKDGDGIGTQPLWIQFGLKIPPSRLVPFQPNAGSWKFAIIANISVSNPLGMGGQSSNLLSHVLTNRVGKGRNFPIVYRHTDLVSNGEPFEGAIPGVSMNNDLDLSPGWDRGARFTDYRDRYCAYSDTRGCPVWPTDVWVWFMLRMHVRTYGGTAGNELDFWWALPGDTKWRVLQSHRNYSVGSNSAPWTGGFNAIHLTPFETDRVGPGGVDTWLQYRHLIVSTEEPAFPALSEPANALPSGTIGPSSPAPGTSPCQSGHGLVIEILPDNRFYATWFAFNPLGTQQSWFTGVGTYSGNTATITVVDMPAGGRWIPNFDPRQVVRNAWGTLTFTFTDCNHGTVNFNSMMGYGTGSMNLTRLTLPAGLTCP